MTELRWLTSPFASALRECGLLVRVAKLADAEARPALRRPAFQFRYFLDDAAIVYEDFFEHLVPLAVGEPNPARLAEVTLTKVVGRSRGETLAQRLAGILREVERLTAVRPDEAREIELRSGPLREQWEAYGPGLLRAIGRWTEMELLPARADVILLRPALGGGGAAWLPYNIVGIEAVLTNTTPGVPEFLRLAWLLSQLEHDRPMFGNYVPRCRLRRVGALAMLPAALTAAQELEILRDATATIPLALTAWELSAEKSAALSEALLTWWGTYEVDRPAWAVALAALDRMLEAG